MPDPLPVRVVGLLRDLGLSLATAESLTGGLLGATLTSVPGASAVFRGGIVAYATDLKERLLGVAGDVLREEGAVSRRTALAMAAGVRDATGADWALATTGVAGPDPQEGHPPGTVWLAVAGPQGSAALRYSFTGSREAIRDQSVAAALELLEEHLRGVAG